MGAKAVSIVFMWRCPSEALNPEVKALVKCIITCLEVWEIHYLGGYVGGFYCRY